MPSFRLNNSGFGFERNVCFVNSVLQFMAAVPIIRNYFLQRSFKFGLHQDYPLCSEIVRIFEMAGSRMITSAGVLRDMIGALEGLERFSTKPAFGNQQDASDFLNVLVSKIEAEVKCRGFEFGHSGNCMVPWFEGKEQLEFKFLNSDDGSCPICFEMPDSTIEPFQVLHLYNNNSVATSIQELLWENLEQPTPLERRCSKCEYGQDQKATSFRSISQYPAVLFVHVPKFEIQIKSRASDEFLTIGNEKYELCAVMDHLGTSPNCGHWIVWSKCQDGSGWIKCDDKDITDVLFEEKIYSRNNFLLAYLRSDKKTSASPTPTSESSVFISKQPNSSSKRSPTSPSSPSSTRSSKSQKKDVSSTSSTSTEIKCRGCFRPFKLLMGHLSKSKTCQEFYDMDAMKNDQKKRRLENGKERIKRFRANQTAEDKAEENEKAVKRMENFRAVKTPEEKKKDKENDAIRKKNDRAARTPEKKKEDNEKVVEIMKNIRAVKTPEEKKKDKENDALRKKNDRAARTPEKKKEDNEKVVEIMKNVRAAKTPDQKQKDKENDAIRKKNDRAAMTPDEKQKDKENDAKRKKNDRDEKGKDPFYKQNVAAMKASYRQKVFKRVNETAIGRHRVFLETVRDGPIYACVSCHRLLYNNGVVEIISMGDFRDKLNDLENGLFEKTISASVIPNLKGKFYLCLTCKKHLYNKRMPPMNHNNNLEIFDNNKAPQMKLSELESSCIARNLLFMKIHNLPRSGMKGVTDKTVCVPIDSETINKTINSFPRVPSEATLVPIKLKRKQSYKNTHLQEYVNPTKMIAALEYLKSCGHKYYQFEFETSVEEYLERCAQDLEDGDPSSDDSSSSSSSSDNSSSSSVSDNNGHRSSSTSDSSKIDEDVSKNSDCSVNDDKLKKSTKANKYNLKTRMKEAQEDEDEFLKMDASGKFQFNYNKVTAFSNNYPEIHISDQPLIIAPGEGKKPISMLLEDDWDLKSHPHLDPTGKNSMNSKREVRLTNVQYVEQRLKNVNPTYANCFSWLFACKNLIELKQLTTRVNMSVMRGNKKEVNGKTTYGLEDAFQVFDGISGTSRFWQKKKMELQAMVENIGSFHLFFTLSAADSRYPENFTSLLQDHNITYVYREGQEECLIDGLTIDEFIQQNSSKFEFIRDNILTATRNYNFRVKSFIKIVVMNIYSELRCKYYSYRVEFQLRGSAHIHGVLFLDIDEIVKNEIKKGFSEYEFLNSALRKCRENEVPSEDENRALVSFVNKFVTCTLWDPRTSKIAASVQKHNHTFTCRKAGSKCRFHFPRFPSLHTILAKPLRIVFNEENEEKRKETVMKIRLALANVRSVLENTDEMEKIVAIWSDELNEIYDERNVVQRSKNILEDEIFKRQILSYNEDSSGRVDDDIGQYLIDNLTSLHEEHKRKLEELERDISIYFRDRLLAVLKKANIENILEINEKLPEEIRDIELLKEYHKLLSFSIKGYSVVLKRDVSEIYINNYCLEWLPIWNSNMDISPVFDYFAVLVYVSDYFMKSDEKIMKILLDAVKEIGHKSLKDKLKVMRDVFLTHRSMGECELYYRLIPSMHLTDSNLGTVYIHTGRKKSRFLRKCDDEDSIENAVSVEDREGLYMESSSILDKYIKRPAAMHDMPLIQFAKRYTPMSASIKGEESQSEEETDNIEEALESSKDNFENSIEQNFIINRDPAKRVPLHSALKLEGTFYKNEPRFMKLRKTPLVIRFHKFKMDTDTHDYCLSQLELFYIFRDENERKKCEEDIEFCYDTFMRNRADINYVQKKSMPFMNYVEEAMEEAEEIMHNDIGETLDAENEKLQEDCETEGNEETETFVAFEYGKEESDKDSLPADKMFKRIEISEIEILSQSTRDLDNDQMYVVQKLIDYAKSYQRSRVTDEPIPEPVTMKIFGNAGTGKSHIINIVAQWVEFILRQTGDNIDCPYVIKCAFTGSASSAIDGQTLHRAFSLTFADRRDEGKYKSLNDKTKEKLSTVLRNLRLVIIDEFSMIKPEHLYQIDLRLREIKHLSKEFGGCCLLLFGDPMQLKPVQGRYAWDEPTAKQYQLAHQLKSVWESFHPVILRTNHRQGEDLEFSEVLNRIRIREFTEKDVEFLQTRVVKGSDTKIPADRMYIFARNKEVNEMNDIILSKMAGETFEVEAIVHHDTVKDYEPMVKNTGFIVDTSLMKTLRFKINSKVLLTYNVNVVDGMCNGSFCKIVGTKKSNQGKIIEIHVQFLNPSHGLETSREHPELAAKYGFPVVPIKRMEQKLRVRGKVLGTVLQFALKLSDSVTSHRVQGQTVRDPTAVVVDLKHCRDPGQVYVTLSRAQKLSQLFILNNLYTDNWKTSADALLELRDSEKEALNTIKKDDKNFEIISMNIRSLRKRYADVVRLFEFQPSDVLCLQETWLMPGEDPVKYEVGGMIPWLNSVGFGKGLATYCSSPFQLKQHYCLEDCQLTKITSEKLEIINVYRSSQCRVFEEELKLLINVKKPTIVCGDTNINVGTGSCKLLDIMNNLGFDQLVTGSTHDKGGCIDQVFVSSFLNATVEKTRVQFTDHDQLRIIIKDFK